MKRIEGETWLVLRFLLVAGYDWKRGSLFRCCYLQSKGSLLGSRQWFFGQKNQFVWDDIFLCDWKSLGLNCHRSINPSTSFCSKQDVSNYWQKVFERKIPVFCLPQRFEYQFGRQVDRFISFLSQIFVFLPPHRKQSFYFTNHHSVCWPFREMCDRFSRKVFLFLFARCQFTTRGPVPRVNRHGTMCLFEWPHVRIVDNRSKN
jgi:hypothetical protein